MYVVLRVDFLSHVKDQYVLSNREIVGVSCICVLKDLLKKKTSIAWYSMCHLYSISITNPFVTIKYVCSFHSIELINDWSNAFIFKARIWHVRKHMYKHVHFCCFYMYLWCSFENMVKMSFKNVECWGVPVSEMVITNQNRF